MDVKSFLWTSFLLLDSAQGSDLVLIFGDLSTSKNISEINLPLIVDHTCRSYEGHDIKHQKNPWKVGTFINTSKKVSIFTFGSIFTNKIHCDLIHGINTNETWKTSVTRHRGLKFEEVTNFPLTLSPLWTRIIYGKYVIWVVQFPMKGYKII